MIQQTGFADKGARAGQHSAKKGVLSEKMVRSGPPEP
jgi:hypothetical protein